MATWLVALGPVGLIAGAVVTWLVARRSKSGRINTTEAETLWTESQAMRKELRDEVSQLREQLVAGQKEAREEVAALRRKYLEEQRLNKRLRAEIAELRKLCGLTNEGVEAVRAELSAAKAGFAAMDRAKERPVRKPPTTPRKRGG